MPPSVKPKPPHRRFRRFLQWMLILGFLLIGGSNFWIIESTRHLIYADPALIPANDVGLVLGTSRSVGGYANPFFEGRMDAAAALYHAGKVHHLILSGDNRIVAYDEPKDMRAALIARGVPETILTLDAAGFRTLDSMARARAIFGLSKVTIITDDFHAPRALVLGRNYDLDCGALTSAPVPLKWSLKTRLREVAARVKTVFDLTILRTRPHFLGNPEPIN